MLSTTFTYITFAFSLLACIFAGIATQLALRQVRDERDFKKILMHLAELEDLHEALAASHKRLRSRIGMQEMRARRKNGEDVQDTHDETEFELSKRDPEAWKAQMRLKLRK